MSKFLCRIMIGLLAVNTGQGQSFRMAATVESPAQSGYHRILLPPDVVGQLNSQLTDIRLYDSQQQEVPYLLLRQQPAQLVQFVDYEVVSRRSVPRVATTVVVKNGAKKPISSLSLLIRNTNVGKKVRLSGSSDARTWYAIDDDLWLSPTHTSATTTDTKAITFPLSDYAYFRLDINDSLSSPLNIVRIGYYQTQVRTGNFSPISGVVLSQRDSSDTHTYVHLKRSTAARFDKLTIQLKAGAPFRRQAVVGHFRTQKRKRGRVDRWFEVIRSIELSSSANNVVYLPGLKTKDLYLIIANDNNPPLIVNGVQASQLTTFLVANLSSSSSYQIRFQADDDLPPAYDQTPFRTISPAKLPVVGIRDLRSIDQQNRSATTSLFTNRWLIWTALGLVLLLLGFMSYRMLREMGESTP